MIFEEKLVLFIPLAHYGIIDGLINYERDVTCDVFDEASGVDDRDSNGNLWWHADVNIGCDDEGNELPYQVTAHGLVNEQGKATTDKLWLSVDSDYGHEFNIKSGLRISECI